MNIPTPTESELPRASRPTISRATIGPDNRTAQPSLTSGFGVVLEIEHEIQSATADYLGEVDRPHSAAIDRVLRDQQARVGANIALLGQRYEMLPHPNRFQTAFRRRRPSKNGASTPERHGRLASLAARHENVLLHIENLIAHRPDGQRGELILGEVARHHVEMARALMALRPDDAAPPQREPVPVIADGTAAEGWDNEGGATPRRAGAFQAGTMP